MSDPIADFGFWISGVGRALRPTALDRPRTGVVGHKARPTQHAVRGIMFYSSHETHEGHENVITFEELSCSSCVPWFSQSSKIAL